jgi:hypothetical protein
MDNQLAINILVQVAHIAQKGGLLSLEDAIKVNEAINVVLPKVKEAGAKKIGGGILGSPR